MGLPVTCGKLGISLEGVGNRRVFAIGNYVKQRLLYPYHEWLMKIIRTMPNDGTFSQSAPLRFLVGCTRCYSYDLMSATDRWPLFDLYSLFQSWFGPASSVVNTTLGTNVFDVLLGHRYTGSVCFVAGQPLLSVFTSR